ncbi:MAG: hypothetical protein ACRD0P_01860 [Stackebrandtia sp.]
MKRQAIAVIVAGCGALAYTVSKVDLALRGELGLPGFPAPAASYEIYEPVSGQLSNAAVGLAMVLVVAALLRPPAKRWLRRGLLAANWLGAVAIAIMVVSFTCRATGLTPAIGEPAIGPSTWIALAVGAVWTAAWIGATAGARPQTSHRQKKDSESKSPFATA